MQDLGAPQHPQPLDRYFALSDTAGRSEDDFEELIALFAPDARIEPASGPAVQGTTAIREFFHDFFARNAETRHLWLTRPRQDAPEDGARERTAAGSSSTGPWRSGAPPTSSSPWPERTRRTSHPTGESPACAS